MWHTTEIVKIFKKITDRYGYEIYENRKLCVALCNDLLVAYAAEKNILRMLFQAGLGEAMKGVPYKSEEELNRGLTKIDKFMLKQAIDSQARSEVLAFINQTFVLEGIKISNQSPSFKSNSSSSSSYAESMSGGLFYTTSDIKDYSDALRNEILFLKQGKGRKYKIVNGQKLNRDDKGIYTYSFEMETELHLPDDAPVIVEVSSGLRAVGSVLSCEDFQMLLLLDRDLTERVSSAYLTVEPWKLLEALDKRINSLNPNVSQLAVKIIKKGPELSTNDNIANVPKGKRLTNHTSILVMMHRKNKTQKIFSLLDFLYKQEAVCSMALSFEDFRHLASIPAFVPTDILNIRRGLNC